VLVNPTSPNLAEPISKDMQAAGRALGQQIHVLNASTEGEIDACGGSRGHTRLMSPPSRRPGKRILSPVHPSSPRRYHSLLVNLQTAKMLGIEVPLSLLIRAEE
jgi:hypothetical protein